MPYASNITQPVVSGSCRTEEGTNQVNQRSVVRVHIPISGKTRGDGKPIRIIPFHNRGPAHTSVTTRTLREQVDVHRRSLQRWSCYFLL